MCLSNFCDDFLLVSVERVVSLLWLELKSDENETPLA